MANTPEAPKPLRRIVTGHNTDGKCVVEKVDELPCQELSAFPGVKGRTLWVTNQVPAKDNNDPTDGATREAKGDMGIVSPGGTYFNVTDLAPGASTRWHRTSSIDHNILISGKLILQLDDGTEHVLDRPGDTVVQRGGMHAWHNPGPEWARWTCVLIDAAPAVVNGKPLLFEDLGRS